MSEENEVAGLAALLTCLAPVALLVGVVFHGAPVAGPLDPRNLALLGHLGAAFLLIGAAVVLPGAATMGRILATVGVIGATALSVAALLARPDLAFLLMLVIGLLLIRVWPMERATGAIPAATSSAEAEARLRASAIEASVGAVLAWVLAVPAEWGEIPPVRALATISVGYGLLSVVRWSFAERRTGGRAWRQLLPLAGISALAAGAAWQVPLLGLTFLVVVPAWLLASRLARTLRVPASRFALWESLLEEPARLLVLGFAALVTVGTLLLALPVASAAGTPLPFLDAAFTAVSASCVTGLIVLDTPTDFAIAGQGIILLLIQVGGLGIMTFSTAALALLGRRMSLRHEGVAAGLLGAESRGGLFLALRRMLLVTVVAEGLGALLLTLLFLAHGDAPAVALWRGAFTAISAFCNAGFALQSDSLIPYQQDALVLHVVAALIVIGGLGPVAVVALPALARRGRASLQARLIYVVTAVALVLPFLGILAFEWTGALGHLPLVDRVHNAWFQAVTLRTAGFNSVDFGALHPATITLMIGLMFVGGSPGSTAGGAKTTTVALLALAVVAALRGRAQATAFGRRLPHDLVYKAAAIATVGVLAIGVLLVALQITQQMPMTLALFEAVSALATVGLSLGGTTELDEVGKVLIMAAMFAGRVGPLTLFLLLVAREERRPVGYPEEQVAVG